MSTTKELIADVHKQLAHHKHHSFFASDWRVADNLKALLDHIESLSAEVERVNGEAEKFRKAWFDASESNDQLRSEVERHKQDWSRFHHLMKDFGLHPGRTDDDLLDILRAQLEAQGEAVPYWSEVIGMFVERLNNGPQTTAASDVLALLNDCQYLASLSTHPAPAAPVVDIDAMVSRFLGWSLPDDFSPDCHISFDRDAASYNQHAWPDGTNLLNAAQARAMLEYVLALHPTQPKGEKT